MVAGGGGGGGGENWDVMGYEGDNAGDKITGAEGEI